MHWEHLLRLSAKPKFTNMATPVNWIKFKAVLLLTLTCLASCIAPPEFTRDFAQQKISESMSTEEVVQLIGPPDEIENLKTPDGSGQLIYRYLAKIDHGKGNILIKELIMIFKNNKIIRKSYSEKIILKTEKDSRPSNSIFQIK